MKLDTLYTTDLHDEGAEIEILDYSNKPSGLYIKVVGVDSKIFRNEAKKQQKLYIEAVREKKDFDDDEVSLNSLVASTIGWRGTDQKFSKKLCKELYQKAPYVRDQVDRFIAERGNFIKAKPKK
tara:strand:+ start:467 stop:838 length:372 start_codon:yes stop_codon:yes gene_type:complete